MIRLLIWFLVINGVLFSQTVTIWSEDFNSGIGDWTLNIPSGFNAPGDPNIWEISDAEGGVAPPGCGVAGNGNNSLHVTCQGFICALIGSGAIYNAGGFGDYTTDVRTAYSVPISTIGETDLEYKFNWIGVGQNGFDFAEAEYSIDGGNTWEVIWTQTPGATCPSGQGQWTEEVISLPPNAENQADLRFAFRWRNNNDGIGSDPSFAVDDIELRVLDEPLPVTLENYNLKCNENDRIITWSTESELNNDYFEIEFSENGEGWEVIQTIDGNGTTNQASTYEFTHSPRIISEKVNYYKVTQYDYDGAYEELFILSSQCSENQEELNVFPNPAENEFSISLNDESDIINSEIQIFNSSGKLVLVRKNLSAYLIKINHQLPSGSYIVKVLIDEATEHLSKKLIIK